MKIKLKAYKCTFPNLFIDSYNDYMWKDPKQYEVIFGKTQKEAVKKRCQFDECYDYWELKKNINTQVFPEKNLYSQEKSEFLKNLSNKQINHLTHSLGVEIGDVCPKSFYRNYSMYYKKEDDCESLVEAGLMDNWQKMESEVYCVTEKGIEAVKTLLLVIESSI